MATSTAANTSIRCPLPITTIPTPSILLSELLASESGLRCNETTSSTTPIPHVEKLIVYEPTMTALAAEDAHLTSVPTSPDHPLNIDNTTGKKLLTQLYLATSDCDARSAGTSISIRNHVDHPTDDDDHHHDRRSYNRWILPPFATKSLRLALPSATCLTPLPLSLYGLILCSRRQRQQHQSQWTVSISVPLPSTTTGNR